VQTAGRPTDSGLQWLADFSRNLIIYVTKQGSLKCLAQEAEVNQAKHCALGAQAVRTEVAAGSTLGVIKYTLIMIIYGGITLMFARAWIIQNTQISYERYRLLLPRRSVATANKVMCKYCCWGTRWRRWWRHYATSRRSQVWFPMVSLEFFIDIILVAALWPWGRLSL